MVSFTYCCRDISIMTLSFMQGHYYSNFYCFRLSFKGTTTERHQDGGIATIGGCYILTRIPSSNTYMDYLRGSYIESLPKYAPYWTPWSAGWPRLTSIHNCCWNPHSLISDNSVLLPKLEYPRQEYSNTEYHTIHHHEDFKEQTEISLSYPNTV